MKPSNTGKGAYDNLRCNSCRSDIIVTDHDSGELVCSRCGMVLSERLEDSGPEFRNFLDSDKDRSRTGDKTALSRHDRGLATMIGLIDKDASGKILSSSMKTTFNRLRIWDNRSQANSATERNFRNAFNILSRLKDKLSLNDAIIEKTAYIYRKAIERKIIKGRSISALISASLYAACRDAETPRTLNDIATASNIKRKELAKCYRILVKELNLKVPVLNSVQCISRISSKLDIPEKTKRHAIKILREYQSSGDIAGKNPIGLAATALYLANVITENKHTQREVAEAANITEVTIRNRGASIRRILDITKIPVA